MRCFYRLALMAMVAAFAAFAGPTTGKAAGQARATKQSRRHLGTAAARTTRNSA